MEYRIEEGVISDVCRVGWMDAAARGVAVNNGLVMNTNVK